MAVFVNNFRPMREIHAQRVKISRKRAVYGVTRCEIIGNLADLGAGIGIAKEISIHKSG